MADPLGMMAPPGDPAMLGIAPPPFGAPVITPERRAAVGQLIEAGKALLTAVQVDPTIAKFVNPLAAAVTRTAGQLQRPPEPQGDDAEREPELDRTPTGPPSMPGNPMLSLATRAMGGV